MAEWRSRYGQLPSSYDWFRPNACRARARRTRAPRGGSLAGGERRHAPFRYLARRAGGGRRGEDEGAGVGGFAIWQGIDPPAETPGIDRYIRGSERR